MSSAGEWASGRGSPVGPLVGDLVEPVAQPLGQAAGVGEDDGGAVRLDQVGDPLLHVRPDRGLLPPGRPSLPLGLAGEPPSSPRSSTGTTTDRSNSLPDGGWTIVDLAARREDSGPPRPPGARSPTARYGGRAASAARPAAPGTARGGRRAWCPPPRAPRRGSPSRPRSAPPAAPEVSIRNSDSGVVIRMSGGRVAIARRSAAGVSPERIPTLTSGSGSPSRTDSCRMPVSGLRRLRSTSTASAFSGDTYSTRQRLLRVGRRRGRRPAGPARRGRRPASCRSRSARRPARPSPRPMAARRPPAPRWAR